MLKAIGNMLGHFLCPNQACKGFTCPGVASICTEMDISKPLKKDIKLILDGEVVIQKIDYPKNLPKYCQRCVMLGHN
jgi:hypothetical protein